MRDNAWNGMQYRQWFCYLIFVKPFVAYAQSFVQLAENKDDENKALLLIVRMLVMLCTIVPAQAISCFTNTLSNLSGMQRYRAKLAVIQLLAPLLQIQQTVIGLFLFFFFFFGVFQILIFVNRTNNDNK
ncbi:hypothetical protein RFI_11831 [Reticulomyxa filosa]|uniref:Uncharacterized protein n=1 Tax=Reticulomyxa filosa TaxID=46433 RepID=X6NG50_RETFI|nr:hypothetical protein RFI_11831 [Reticulomyxa filosa]|eukprot:ETO25305.1 hypothetical protein RFI_11831 [Reticulomyxa filosa]